jgi:hypothetical protein
MSIQPFRGAQVVVVEKRKPDGSLDFSAPQPPTARCTQHSRCEHDASPGEMTFDHLYQVFFREVPDQDGSWDNLNAWLTSKGWTVRAKTW